MLSVLNSPSTEAASTNKVFLNTNDGLANSKHVLISDYVFQTSVDNKIPNGSIGLNSIHRRMMNLALNEQIYVAQFLETIQSFISTLTMQLTLHGKRRSLTVVSEELQSLFKTSFAEQYFTVDQRVLLAYDNGHLVLSVTHLDIEKSADRKRGVLTVDTDVSFEVASGDTIKLSGDQSRSRIFQPDFNFFSLGIGGLDDEFATIFRRAFASRVFPKETVQELGIKHVKGILLYGPPGTGKTLMARQIGKMLNSTEPKVVSGPEILNKYVGQSEENVRNLFKDAEEEERNCGDDSQLHVIVLDELDAICRTRNSRSDGTGVGDSVVNQLLSKIDGYQSLNNILLIGMTNRIDMIDEALLRPGRFEVHVEISLPNEHGRLQILRIHTAQMHKSGKLSPCVDLVKWAALTKNFSGAEIESLVKNATSHAMNERINPDNLCAPDDVESMMITQEHFDLGFNDVHPTFGLDTDDFSCCAPNGIIRYSSDFDETWKVAKRLIEQVRNGTRTRLLSVLISGAPGSGKTSLALTLAKESGFSYVKLICPDKLIGLSDTLKCQRIAKIFQDAHRSSQSIVVLDDIENLLEYVDIGPRFSNSILQVFTSSLKKFVVGNNRLLIIGTTSEVQVLNNLKLMSVFDEHIPIRSLSTSYSVRKVLDELGEFLEVEVVSGFTGEIAIKRLILSVDKAKQTDNPAAAMVEYLSTCSIPFNSI